MNCSATIGGSVPEIPCFSVPQHPVYTVELESYAEVPDSCRPIKTVTIPFAYSSDGSFGLGLTWELPKGDDDFGFQIKRTWFHLVSKTVPINMIVGLIVLAAATAYSNVEESEDPFYHHNSFK